MTQSTRLNHPGMSKQRIKSQAGFTLIEVGMAALILVVGFIGMIRAMTFTAGLMDHARRQTIAAQILTHEIEQLRLENWATITALPTATTWAAGTSSASRIARASAVSCAIR